VKEKEEYYDITLIDQNSHLELIQQISYIVLGSKAAGPFERGENP
jgi:hypothetical protein